ncbi:hypothetical protein OH687_28495 [Burkholderia anthina]|nr:hypothetical protein OH687_28495 [Burkholderia anthina]
MLARHACAGSGASPGRCPSTMCAAVRRDFRPAFPRSREIFSRPATDFPVRLR